MFPSRISRWFFLLASVGLSALAFWAGRISMRSVVTVAPVPLTVLAPLPATPITSRVLVVTQTVAAAGMKTDLAELLARPSTPLLDQQMLAALEDLATRDHDRAIALALHEPNLRRRQEMLRAVLRGWGQTAPEAAADWALAKQTTLDKNEAFSCVLASVVKNHGDAVRLTQQLIQKNPDHERQFSVALVEALGQNGDFKQAADFAVTAQNESRLDCLSAAYSTWADHQPQAALAAATAIADATLQSGALSAIISKWAANEPQTVIEFAATLPKGDQRQLAFTEGLQNWAANDPVAAAEWINRNQSATELDAGVAAIATSSQLASKPEVAVRWAEIIVEPQTRSRILSEILQQWVATNPDAVRSYLQQSQDLQPEDRDELLAQLNNP